MTRVATACTSGWRGSRKLLTWFFGTRPRRLQGSATPSLLSRTVLCLRLNKSMRYFLLITLIIACLTVYVISNSDVSVTSFAFLTNRADKGGKPIVLNLTDRGFLNHTFLVGGTGVDTTIHIQGRLGQDSEGAPVNIVLPVGHKLWRNLKSAMKMAETASFPWPEVRVTQVDCARLLSGDQTELERATKAREETPMASMEDSNVSTVASDCSTFQKQWGFITSPLTEEEKNFPIAFTIVTFKDAHQVLSLLRAIYRPQNYYCLHVDSKSHKDFRVAMVAIAQCFPNVFLSSRSVDVQWGTFTVLEPELVCMRDLWRYKDWKYLINLTGQEFPLRTNLELVRILTAYNGANNMEGTRKRANKDRWAAAGEAPAGIQPTKGSVHITVNRDFVDFVLHIDIAKQFLDWIRKTGVPDETFFSSLNHNPHLGIRGSYKGDPETHETMYPFLTRFKNWGNGPFDFPCAENKRVRMICILSPGDLPLLDGRPELFANKFYWDYSRLAVECLAERIYNHTRDQFLGNTDFNSSFYASMPFVKNMVTTSTFNRTL